MSAEAAPSADWTAVVLAGGGSRRLGRDKSKVTVGGASLLHRAVAAIPAEVPVVVVGPDPGPLGRPVRVTCEQPSGGGPVAGLLAALPLVDTELLGLLATDMPFAGESLAELVGLLRGSEAEAVLPTDSTGRAQPLCAAYRCDALRRAAHGLGTGHDESFRRFLRGLRIREVVLEPDRMLDVDTPSDLARARGLAAILGPDEQREANMLQDWVDAVRSELGIEAAVDVDLVLDVAKDAAHGVARPAAPLTTYLLGCAVAAGADPQAAAAKIRELASGWPSA